MDAEKIMRTSVFGGFKKEDVISYVEELKKEIEGLKADVEKKDGKIGELNSKVLELTDDCAQLEELKKETAEKSKRISALENQNSEIVERLETLSKVSEEYSNAKSVIERNNREIERLRLAWAQRSLMRESIPKISLRLPMKRLMPLQRRFLRIFQSRQAKSQDFLRRSIKFPLFSQSRWTSFRRIFLSLHSVWRQRLRICL